MGRGRQKAKDAKIARQLKYTNHSSDLRDLERELISSGGALAPIVVHVEPDEVEADDDDPYAKWSEDED